MNLPIGPMSRLPQVTYGSSMTTQELSQITRREDATRVYCAICGHTEFVHADNGNRRCLYSVCDCNRFIVDEMPEGSAQVLPS